MRKNRPLDRKRHFECLLIMMSSLLRMNKSVALYAHNPTIKRDMSKWFS